MRLIATLHAVLLAATAVTAQQNIVWNHNNSPTGGGNAFPFGSAGLRYQALVSNALMGPSPAWIQDILAVALPTLATPREVIYDDIEIRMGMTPAVTLTANWAANNPNPTTVYRGYLRVVYEANVWRGLGLPASFLYLPTPAAPNLCVEFINWSVRGYTNPTNFFSTPTDGTLQRAFLYNWVNSQTSPPTLGTGGGKFGLLLNGGNYVLVGDGCTSSANSRVTIRGPASAWPTRGTPFPVSLSGAPARPSLLLLGLSDTRWGGLPLPLDLALINAPGCMVWNDGLLTVGTVTDPTGNATLPLGIPNAPEFAGLRLLAFWAQVDPGANPYGLTTSGQMKLIVDM